MELTAIVGLGVTAVALIVLLRQYRPEYALLCSVLCSVLIFAAVLSGLLPALSELENWLYSLSVKGEYTAVLFKALGICFITQIACDSCRDAGESAIASKIELAGKFALVVLALPMFREILQIALTFMAL
ncbi:MAG: stage III sporulation protein AD [Provencibacterium sp.]|jgi:stage III sporulation protein AD|nr:stage III sporulation protein AD [Provencibacterium sp.]